ncbi:hypothetical protein [Undibacterium sp. WLX3042]|uniref:hypothetical protein n=1 Tax=Undibacterium sp. WLX3042 TaxID=3412686 RepID=UPI003C2CC9CE
MTSLIKGHLTFSELLERWQINKTDLFHLIADKKLFPSIFLNGFYDVFESGDQGRGWKLIAKEHDYMKWVVQQIESEFDDNFRATEVNGYYYLRFQRQSPLELDAYHVRDRHPSAEWGGRMWRLDEAVQFNCGDDHIGDSDYVVFLREEIERFERASGMNLDISHPLIASGSLIDSVSEPGDQEPKVSDQLLTGDLDDEKDFSSRERNTLLKIIKALCDAEKYDLSSL